MNIVRVSLFVLMIILFHFSYTQERVLPVTTNSNAAYVDFLAGRNAAFHYDQFNALNFLDAALLKDSTFVLAHLHRAGMSNRKSYEREKHFLLANQYAGNATNAEQKLIKAFESFLREGYKDIPMAIKLLSELHVEYPDDHYLPTYIGLRYLFNLNQYAEARKYFERAIKINPNFSQAYQWIAMSYQYEKEYSNAEKYFMKSIELAPEQANPLNFIGELYIKMGKLEAGLTHLLQALERNSYDIYIKDNISKIRRTMEH